MPALCAASSLFPVRELPCPQCIEVCKQTTRIAGSTSACCSYLAHSSFFSKKVLGADAITPAVRACAYCCLLQLRP